MKYKILSQTVEPGLFDTIKTLELEGGFTVSAQYMGDYVGYSVTKGDETLDEFGTSESDGKDFYASEWGEYYKFLDEFVIRNEE